MKLSEKNQAWLDESAYQPAINDSSLFVEVELVEEKLLEMQQRIDELEKENAEWRVTVTAMAADNNNLYNFAMGLGACSEYMKGNFPHSDDAKGLLAQHDKEVIEKAVVDFCCYLMDNGEPIAEDHLMVFGSDFLEQLQEQD